MHVIVFEFCAWALLVPNSASAQVKHDWAYLLQESQGLMNLNQPGSGIKRAQARLQNA